MVGQQGTLGIQPLESGQKPDHAAAFDRPRCRVVDAGTDSMDGLYRVQRSYCYEVCRCGLAVGRRPERGRRDPSECGDCRWPLGAVELDKLLRREAAVAGRLVLVVEHRLVKLDRSGLGCGVKIG